MCVCVSDQAISKKNKADRVKLFIFEKATVCSAVAKYTKSSGIKFTNF